jgi:mRNA-degrading endonuclease RelE of RelBE toxin-antitoxin system
VKVRLTPSAAREVRALPPQVRARLKKALARLAADPHGRKGLDVKRLRSPQLPEPVYRVRVGGWRAVYLVRGSTVAVVRVFARDEGYGWMERFRFL